MNFNNTRVELQYLAYIECKQFKTARNLPSKNSLHEILTVISQATSTTVTGNGCSTNTCAELGLKTNYGNLNILYAAVKVVNHLHER